MKGDDAQSNHDAIDHGRKEVEPLIAIVIKDTTGPHHVAQHNHHGQKGGEGIEHRDKHTDVQTAMLTPQQECQYGKPNKRYYEHIFDFVEEEKTSCKLDVKEP